MYYGGAVSLFFIAGYCLMTAAVVRLNEDVWVQCKTGNLVGPIMSKSKRLEVSRAFEFKTHRYGILDYFYENIAVGSSLFYQLFIIADIGRALLIGVCVYFLAGVPVA